MSDWSGSYHSAGSRTLGTPCLLKATETFEHDCHRLTQARFLKRNGRWQPMYKTSWCHHEVGVPTIASDHSHLTPFDAADRIPFSARRTLAAALDALNDNTITHTQTAHPRAQCRDGAGELMSG